MANRWGNNGNSDILYFLGSKITADDDFSHEIKRHLPLRVGKGSTCNAGDPGSIPRSGRSTGEGIAYPLQYSWASLVAQLVKNSPAMQETWLNPWVGKIPWRREKLPTPVFWPGEFHGLYRP